jgi:predicted TIM-barrel fold metal-dependent hydrolase
MDMNDMVIVSVDDHISEPADTFDRQLKGDALATAPKLRQSDNGTDYWEYQGIKAPSVGLNAVVGRPFEEYGMEPTRIDQIRKGVWNVEERIKDMDVNGIAASLNFSSVVGLFHRAPDRDLAVTHMRAYNDWHVDEWCGAHPDRFIACAVLPTWNMDATVAEIHRLAKKGVTAVSLNENPTIQGLPSIHNAYWEPMYKAIAETDIAICLHIGSGNPAPHASPESPIEAWITTMPMSIAVGAADWLHLEALHRYPDLKIALSEGSIGWVPYFMERADFSHWRHKAWTHSHFKDTKPSDLFKKHFMLCFIDDEFGLNNLHFMNEDMISYECDYPHSDSVWPESPEHLWKSVKHLTETQIDKVTHLNAMRFFNFDLFKHGKREDYTVGALRARAKAVGVDTTPISSGGAAPLAPGEEPRGITSGDVMKMFTMHAKAA